MQWTRECAAVIPCFNQAREVSLVVQGTRPLVDRVIVVDDGSTDGTAKAAAAAGAEVIAHPRNLGKGAALQAGWRRAAALGFSWAVSLDGDGQHAPGDIPLFWEKAGARGARMVVGNRLHNRLAIPWLRRHVNEWMTRLLSGMLKTPVADSQCGFRLVHLESLLSLPLAAERFEIESEVLTRFVRRGWRVEYVPIQVIYRRASGSKIRPVADGIRWARWWWGATRGAPRPVSALVRAPSGELAAEFHS